MTVLAVTVNFGLISVKKYRDHTTFSTDRKKMLDLHSITPGLRFHGRKKRYQIGSNFGSKFP